MSIVSQGKFVGRSSSFKYRKSGGIGSGITLSAQRKDSLEKRAISDKQDKETARTKEVSRREKERKQRRIQMVKRVSEETNTEKRQKVVAVSRPDTANTPLDARSKLYKQTQIKNKIIDENEVKTMTFQKYHNLPDSLVSAVTAVLEKVKNPFEDDDKKAKSKKDDDQDDTDDMDMKSKKNDDSDDNEDDDSDRKVGTNGKKTKVELNPKTQSANEELKGNQHKLDKNKNGRLDKHDFKLLRKEEVTLTDEETARIVAKLKESDDKAYKYRDTDPADKNNDYDASKDKNPEHIVMQLRKAKSLGAANRPIHFHDGSKANVSSAHVHKALDMHNSFKKAPDRDDFTQKLQASHASFKKALGEQ
jgi:hypothetical protein